MMLWLVLIVESVVVIMIVVQTLRKRSSLHAEEGEATSSSTETTPKVTLELPEEEKWD